MPLTDKQKVLIVDDIQENIDLLFAVNVIKETAISPDGRRVAWVEEQNNPDRAPSTNAVILGSL